MSVVVYLCPATPRDSCHWEGAKEDLLGHFQERHRDLFMASNTIKVDLLEDGEQNRLLAAREGIFLVQTSVAKEARLKVTVRFLGERPERLRYSVEVITGKFGFVNSGSSADYNPVFNSENGVEVDVQAINSMSGSIDCLLVTINLEVDGRAVELEADPEEELEEPEPSKPLEENQEMLGLGSVRCTSCGVTMTPPIFVCPEGHNHCLTCKASPCALCSQDVLFRNMDLEEICRGLDYPCRYEPQGCSQKFKCDEVRKHELYCEFCAYKCELCSFEGKLHEIKTHFRIVHPSIKTYETMENVPFPRNANCAIVHPCGVFYCSSKASETYLEWCVVFCGPKERYFSCEVKVSGKKQPKYYYLKRHANYFRWTVALDELKNAGVKEKNAVLSISPY